MEHYQTTTEAITEQRYLETLKKLKTLNVKFEREKHQSSTLQNQVHQLEKKLAQYEGAHVITLPSGSNRSETEVVLPGSDEDYQKQIKHWKEAAEKSQKNVVELRRLNQQLKDEIKRYATALKKELGEEVPLDKVLDEGRGWRGRAQQITLLQQKLKELRNGGGASSSSLGDPADGATSVAPSAISSRTRMTTTTTKDVDEVQRENIERIEQDKQTKINQLTLQLTEATSELKELRRGNEAQKARSLNLEKQNTELKTKLHKIISKTENDDKLIDAYKVEINKLKQAIQGGGGGGDPTLPLPNDSQELMEKDQAIDDLRAELQRAQKKLLESMYGTLTNEQHHASAIGGGDKSTTLRLKLSLIEVDKLNELVTLLRSQMDAIVVASCNNGTTSHSRGHPGKNNNTTAHSGSTVHVQPKGGENEALEMLKAENLSLKQQLRTLVLAKQAEIDHYQAVTTKQKHMFDAEFNSLSSSRASSAGSASERAASMSTIGVDVFALQNELSALKQQYTQLKKQFNTMQIKALQP